MTSLNKSKIVQRNNAVRKIHPINSNWLLNNKDSKLSLSGRPQTGVNNQRIGDPKTITGDDKNPIKNNKVSGSELFLRDKPQNGVPKASIGNEKLQHISTRKIRERLIHMLGFNSYTKIELYAILQREGLRDCESKVIHTVLKDISQICKGVYSLRQCIWREVDEKWPYYTAKQVQQVKIRKERGLNPSNNSKEVTSLKTTSSLTTRTNLQQHENKPLKTDNASKRPSAPPSDSQPSKKRRTDYSTEHLNYNFHDYTEIINLEQRQQYKAAFDRYYAEYMPLLQQHDELKRSFRALGVQILDIPADHTDYERIQKCIVEKFKRINSEDELKRKQRCDYLHAKLDHIKQLITLYDRKRLEESAVAFAMSIANQYRQQSEQQHIIRMDDREILTAPKSDGIPSTKNDGAAKAPKETPHTKHDCIPDIMTDDLALSDSDEEMIVTPKDDATTKVPQVAPRTKYECISNILTDDLMLSDSDSDEEMIATPTLNDILTTKDNGAAKARIEIPSSKYESIPDILTNDLALSDSDSDED